MAFHPALDEVAATEDKARPQGLCRDAETATWSGSRLQVLSNDARVACSDTEESKCRALGLATALFPVAKGVHADAHGVGELFLGKPDEATEGLDVVWSLESPGHEAAPDGGWNGTRELLLGHFGNVSHWVPSR